VTSPHPKVTVYLPQTILDLLDDWKSENSVESLNEAIVEILADYLGVPNPAQQDFGIQMTTTRKSLSTTLAELEQRLTALESKVNQSVAVPVSVSGNALSTTFYEEPNHTTSNSVSDGVTTVGDEVLDESLDRSDGEPSTVSEPKTVAVKEPPVLRLTGEQLAARLGVHSSNIRRHNKHGDLSEWTQRNDPEGISWEFSKQESDRFGKYEPSATPTFSSTELARRLNVTEGTLTKRRRGEDFGEWSQGEDPDGIKWEFNAETKRYLPL
jgi:hypothetical protein